MNSRAYHIKEISKILKATIIQFSTDDSISELATDSRQLIDKKHLFFCIISPRNDGHKFIADAYRKGVRNFVLSRQISLVDFKAANFIKVEDCLQALQQLAIYHRQRFTIPIIGITGSNGKTTVKEWLYQLLHNEIQIVRSPKSFNSQVGVPLSVWNISAGDELGIFEAGISKKNEMQNLQKIISPDIGIITNIGDAHSENFSSEFEIAQEKLKLFSTCEKVIYCRDYESIDSQIEQLSAAEIYSWSFVKEARLKITSVEVSSNTSKVKGLIDNESIEFSIAFLDKASVENSITCWLSLYALGYKAEEISFKMHQLQQVAMRLELKEGINGSTLINDSYNSDFQSLKIALQLLAEQNQHTSKVLILSDIMQVHIPKKELYGSVSELFKEYKIDFFIGIGDELGMFKDLFNSNSLFYRNTKDFLQEFQLNSIKDQAVLIKGARKFEFEKITEVLQQKSHETQLEINLSAMVDNLNFFRSKLKQGTKVMGMVKAFSYGAGAHEIANVLQFHKLDYLAVAYADEGVSLRKAGISLPMMVMNPETESYENMIRHRLEPEIYSLRVLNKFQQALDANQYFITDEKAYPVHIKLDTGMHRLGFMENELDALIEILLRSPEIEVVSIFSHLTSSEDPEQDKFSYEQIELFEKMARKLQTQTNSKAILHILNSNGILRFPNKTYDMVRLGIGLYGILSLPEYKHQLRPISVLKTSISQIKELPKGETIGYSRSGVMKEKGRIATLPIGYADGLSRNIGKGNWKVQIGKQLFPTIGNICMDMCMVDIGNFPANEGDEVIVFGNKKGIYELSAAMEKSPYEVLTGISNRVKRVYYFE